MRFNEEEIRRAISVLHPDELFEIRFLGVSGRLNYSAYFHSADDLINALHTFNPNEDGQFYIVLNTINDACASRQQYGQFIRNCKNTTSDNDITAYKWLMIDLDPKRPSGVSSSDEELEKAHSKACTVFSFLESQGFEAPVVALSGNGYHLLYRIDNEVTDGMIKTVKDILQKLNLLFSDSDVDIDTSVYNPSRICKLYGTYATKGQNTHERPHRMAKLIKVPDEIRISLNKRILVPFVGENRQEESPQKYNSYSPNTFSVEDFFTKHGIRFTEKIKTAGATKYILACCPFDSNHKGKDACVIQGADGRLGFHCFHASCADKGWKDFRMFYEPTAYEKNYLKRYDRKLAPRPRKEIRSEAEEKLMFSAKEVFAMPKIQSRYIRSGIPRIDESLGGFRLGSVSLLSGLRASGKSSLLSQFALQGIQQGEKIFIYSGELTAQNVCSWLLIQAAGNSHTHPDTESLIQNKYEVNADAVKPIQEWIDENCYIYNNDCNHDFDKLKTAMVKAVEEKHCTLLLLDNLMTIDISQLDYDIYQRQSAFVGELSAFSKEYNVHIMFVAHPRKSMGFLRLQDVSGSNDIVNRVDNAFICHRINEDFRTDVETTYGKPEAKRVPPEIMNMWSGYTNCIEVCKNREYGIQDVFAGLHYQIPSKRLCPYDGNRSDVYAWEEKYEWIPENLFAFRE